MTFKDHFSVAASGYAAHRPDYPPSVAEALVINARRECHRAARTFLRENAHALADEAERKGVTDIRAMLAEALYRWSVVQRDGPTSAWAAPAAPPASANPTG